MGSSKKIIVFLVVIISLTSCSQILNYYINPDIDHYSIHRIALLPMIWDDTTDEGTYYSTNHLINKIYDEREGIELAEIDSLRSIDCTETIKLFDKIGDQKQINLNKLYSSPIGNFLRNDKSDAILVGTIDSAWVQEKVLLDGWAEWASTNCLFNYFIFSLKDGRLLFRINALGSSGNYVSPYDPVFPPLDVAICEGIDHFFDKFPFKKRTRSNGPL